MKKFLFLLVLATSIISCQNDRNGDGVEDKDERILPSSTGTHSELLVLMKDEEWKGPLGETFREHIALTQYGLPQNEPIFRISQIDPSQLSSILKRSKSILSVTVGDTNLYQLEKDVYARPQTFFSVIGKTEGETAAILKKTASRIINKFRSADLALLQKRLKKSSYKKVPKPLASYGIKDMILLKGFTNTLDKDEIKIYWLDGLKTTQGILVTKRKTPNNVIAEQDIVAFRDSLTKHYVTGSNEGSYMAIEKMLPPLQKNLEIDGHFAIETRGLWQMEGDFMGGPFLSYSIYLDETDEVLTLDAFVYGPEEKKRPIMFELEAMMKSVVF